MLFTRAISGGNSNMLTLTMHYQTGSPKSVNWRYVILIAISSEVTSHPSNGLRASFMQQSMKRSLTAHYDIINPTNPAAG